MILVLIFSGTRFISDTNRLFKCDRGGSIPNRELCIFHLDVDGIVTGCRDFSHLQDCGKKALLYTLTLIIFFAENLCVEDDRKVIFMSKSRSRTCKSFETRSTDTFLMAKMDFEY